MALQDYINMRNKQLALNEEQVKKRKSKKQNDVDVSNDDTSMSNIQKAALLNKNRSVIEQMAEQGLKEEVTNGFYMPTEQYDKYAKNIRVTKYKNLDKELADSQSEITKIGNGFFTGLVSNFALGIVGGIADLFVGLPVYLYNKVVNGTDDYHNLLSDLVEKGQKAVEDFAPIHVDPTQAETGDQSIGSFIGQTEQTVGTMASFLLPTNLYVGALSKVAKTARLGRAARGTMRFAGKSAKWMTRVKDNVPMAEMTRMQKASVKFNRAINNPKTVLQANQITGTATHATVNRFLWNYQEGRHTYDQMYLEATDHFNNMTNEDYQEWLDNNKDLVQKVGSDKKDDIAKYISRQAADTAFAFDWYNIGFDLLSFYTLRNTWKNPNNTSKNTAKFRRLQNQEAKALGKSEADKVKIKEGVGFKQKAKETIVDTFRGGKTLLAGQLNGGAQMAIVHIGSEEGLGYGKSLLIGEKQDPFNRRLNDYLESSELWEGVFMGVVGGIAHHGLGSAIGKAKNKLAYNRELKRAKNEKTGEDTSSVRGKLIDMFLKTPLTQNEIYKKEIEARARKTESFATTIGLIKEGKNPFKTKEDGGFEEISSELEKEYLLDRAETEYMYDIARSAQNAGNGKLLEEWIDNKDVQQYFIEKGVTNGEELAEYTSKLKKIIKDVNDTYEKHLDLITPIIADINSENKDSITSDYIQLIVDNNARHDIQARRYEERLNRLNLNAEQKRAAIEALAEKYPFVLNTKVGDFTALDYRSMVKIGILAKKLGELQAERKSRENKEKKNLDDLFVIQECKEQEERIKREIINKENGELRTNVLAYVARIASGYVKDGDVIKEYDSKVAVENDKELFKLNDDGTVDYNSPNIDYLNKFFGIDILKHIDNENFNKDNEAFIRTVNAIWGDESYNILNLSDVLAKADKKGYDKVATEELKKLKLLHDDYTEIAQLEEAIADEKLQIKLTREGVENKVNEYHNNLLTARRKVISEATNIINSYSKKYGYKTLSNILDAYSGGKNSIDQVLKDNKVEEVDGDKIKDALTLLNLSSANNKSLYYTLKNALTQKYMFEMLADADEVGAETKEKSTVDQNRSSAEQKAEAVTNIQKVINDSNEQENGQKSNVGIPLRPKQSVIFNTENDNTKVTVANNTEGIEIIPIPRTTDHTLDFIGKIKNNPDKVGEVNNLTNITDSNGRALFDIKTGFIDGGKIQRNPVVNIDTSTGKMTVIKEGLIGKDEEIPLGEGAPLEEIEGGLDAYNESQLSSLQGGLGEGVDDVEIDPSSGAYGEPIEESTDIVELQTNSIIGAATAFIEANKGKNITDETLNDWESKLKKELEVDGILYEETEENISIYKKWLATQFENVKNPEENTTVFSTIVEGNVLDVLNTSSTLKSTLVEGHQQILVAKVFEDAVANLINQFADVVTLEKVEVGGRTKHILYLEHLLRYVNDATNNKHTAKVLYNILTTYLNTTEGKSKYIIKDLNDTTDDTVLNNVYKSIQQRLEELSSQDSYYRVNILDQITQLAKSSKKEDKESLEKIYDKLDSLKEGDELTISVNRSRITVSSGGVKLGFMTAPKVTRDGIESQVRGWNVLIKIDNGIVSTPNGLKDTFFRWMVPDFSGKYGESDKDHKDIVDLHAFLAKWESLKNEEGVNRKKLIEEFNNLEEIKKARTQGLLGTNTEDPINHLSNLFRYDYKLAKALYNPEEYVLLKRFSVDNWFNTLAKDYSAMIALRDNPTGAKITVNRISNGELTRIHSGRGEANYDNTLPPKEAIAEKHRESARIAIVPPGNINRSIIVSGRGEINDNHPLEVGRTVVAIPNSNGYMQYAHAFPAPISAHKAIRESVLKQVMELLKQHAVNDGTSPESYRHLQTFLSNVFINKNSNKNTVHLFRGVQYAQNLKGIPGFALTDGHINRVVFYFKYQDTDIYSTTVLIRQKDGKEKLYNLNQLKDSKFENIQLVYDELVKFFDETAYFNIDKRGIMADNDSELSLSGYVTRNENGKIEVNIPGMEKPLTYDSYNDYVMGKSSDSEIESEPLIHINTRPVERSNSNFNRVGERTQGGNAVLDINIEGNLGIQIKSNIPNISGETRKTKDTLENKIKTLIKDETSKKEQLIAEGKEDNENTGEKIVEALFKNTDEEDIVKTLLGKQNYKGYEFSIFPKNVIFDPNFFVGKAKDANAASVLETGEVKVGNKFLDFIKRGERKQAARILIHERLHQLIHEHEGIKAYDRLREVHKLYVEANKKDNVIDGMLKAAEFDNYKDKHGNITDEGLEEFLIESITNKTLANRLNEIKIDKNARKKQSLLSYIYDLVSKLFGLPEAAKGSLLKEQLNLVADLFKSEKKTKKGKVKNLEKSDIIVEDHDKPWRDDPTKSNKTKRYYLPDKSKGYFELVKDHEEGFYSFHIKPTDSNNPNAFSEQEKQILFARLVDDLPAGAKLSTWGSISKGGIAAFKRFKDLGLKEVGTRTIQHKEGGNVDIPILEKPGAEGSVKLTGAHFNVLPEHQTDAYKNTINKLNNWIEYAKEHIRFDKVNHKYYHIDENGDETEIEVTASGLKKLLYDVSDPKGDWAFAAEIGNSVDAFLRDFFNGETVLNKKYSNLNDIRKEALYNEAKRLKQYLDDRFGEGKYAVLTEALPLMFKANLNTKIGKETKTIAGTPDMVVVTNDGQVKLFDFKAKRHSIDYISKGGRKSTDRRDYTLAMNAYKTGLEQITGTKDTSLELIWFDQKYIDQGEVIYSTDDTSKEVTVTDTRDPNNVRETILADFEEWENPKLQEQIKDSIIPLSEEAYFEEVEHIDKDWEIRRDQSVIETVKEIKNESDSKKDPLPEESKNKDVDDLDVDMNDLFGTMFSTLVEPPMERNLNSVTSIKSESDLERSATIDKLIENGYINIVCK